MVLMYRIQIYILICNKIAVSASNALFAITFLHYDDKIDMVYFKYGDGWEVIS